jgi:hypothetical protein
MAAVALVQAPGSDFTISAMTTLGADKAHRPSPSEKCVTALLFAAVMVQKLRQTETLLKLNLILGHRHLLAFLQIQFATTSDSIAEPWWKNK